MSAESGVGPVKPGCGTAQQQTHFASDTSRHVMGHHLNQAGHLLQAGRLLQHSGSPPLPVCCATTRHDNVQVQVKAVDTIRRFDRNSVLSNVNGLQASTSSWCSPASDPSGLVAQTDQQSVYGALSSSGVAVDMATVLNRSCHIEEEAAYGHKWNDKKAAHKVQEDNLDEDAAVANYRLTPLDCGSCSMSTSVDACMGSCGACSMTSLDGACKQPSGLKEGHGTVGDYHLDEVCGKFPCAGTKMVWKEVEGFQPLCLFGRRWERFMRSKLFMLDYMFQVMVAEERGACGDLGVQKKQILEHVFRTMVGTIATEVQIRYFLKQQGLYNEIEEVEDHHEKGEEVVNEDDGRKDGSHCDGKNDEGHGVELRRYYEDFKQGKRMKAAPLNRALGNTEDVPRDAGKMEKQHQAGDKASMKVAMSLRAGCPCIVARRRQPICYINWRMMKNQKKMEGLTTWQNAVRWVKMHLLQMMFADTFTAWMTIMIGSSTRK